MSDRHKYRVWYKCSKCGKIFANVFTVGQRGWPPFHNCSQGGTCDYNKISELEQCTGLSAAKSYRGDKPEDLLIFEGDVLRVVGCEHDGVVAWNRNLCWYQLLFPKFKNWGTFPSESESEGVEIIGNVHGVRP